MRKAWLKRAALAVGAVFIVSATWFAMVRFVPTGNSDLAAAFAETERTDPDWRWDALNAARPTPPPGRNGADLIPRIHGLTPAGFLQKLEGDWPGYELPPPTNARYPDVVIAEARLQLGSAGPAVELARGLKDYPFGRRDIVLRPDVVNTLLEDTQYTRSVAGLLKWDAVLAVENGNPDRAADALLAALHASRSIGDEPFLISQLVRFAVRGSATRSLERTLAHVELPDARLAGLQSAWAADAEEPLLLHGLRGERATIEVLFGNIESGTVDVKKLLSGPTKGGWEEWKEGYELWRYRGRIAKDRAYAHRWLTRAAAAARLPAEQQPAAFRALPPFATDPDLQLSRAFVGAVDIVAGAYWRYVAETRCAAVAVACERHRLKHGRWPAALTDLTPEFIPSVPADPFDAMPLRYRRLPDGVVVYSVGKNGTDDGGQTSLPGGMPGDEGFRLWDPAHRRQPAPQPSAEEKPEP